VRAQVAVVLGPFGAPGAEPLAPDRGLDQAGDGSLRRQIAEADRIETDDALRPDRPVQEIFGELGIRGGLRPAPPPEMPAGEFVALQHARSLADGEIAYE